HTPFFALIFWGVSARTLPGKSGVRLSKAAEGQTNQEGSSARRRAWQLKPSTGQYTTIWMICKLPLWISRGIFAFPPFYTASSPFADKRLKSRHICDFSGYS